VRDRLLQPGAGRRDQPARDRATYGRDQGLRNFVRIGDRRGRFGAAQALPRGACPAKAAIADDGTAILAWAQRGRVRAAFRRAGAHRFGRSIVVARLADRDPAIDDVLVGLDRTGSAGVVAWSDFAGRTRTTAGVRAVDARRRRRVGPAVELDSAGCLSLGGRAVNPAGQAALTCLASDEMQSRIGVVTRDGTGSRRRCARPRTAPTSPTGPLRSVRRARWPWPAPT
jgi:hypothetical protein